MRIGIDGRFWHSSNTGLSQHTKGIINALAKIDNHNQYYIFLRKKDLPEWDLNYPNFYVVVSDIPHFSLREQLIFPLKLLQLKLDLIYFVNFNHPILYPGKFILTIQDLAHFHFPPTGLWQSKIIKLGYFLALWVGSKRAWKIMTDSEVIKEEASQFFSINKNRIDVMPLAADQKRFSKTDKKKMQQLKKKLNIHSPVLLYVGSWRVHKNIKVLIEAFSKIRQRNIKIQLLLVGPPLKEISEIITLNPYKDDIIFNGFISEDQLANYYSLADIFVFPSLYEGFGLPIVEAQLTGLPVVASRINVLKEVGKDSILYFEPGDSDDLAQKLIMVLNDKNLKDDLIKKGKVNIKRFGWDKSAKTLLQIFNEAALGGKI